MFYNILMRYYLNLCLTGSQLPCYWFTVIILICILCVSIDLFNCGDVYTELVVSVC